MIDLSKSQLIETRVAKLHSSVAAIEEGTIMVHAMENGEGCVKPATGAATEQFVGFAISRAAAPLIAPYVETRTVPASSAYTITLSKPIDGTAISVVKVANGVRTAFTIAGSASAAGTCALSGNVLTFHADDASATVELVYRYAITMAEAALRFKGFDGFLGRAVPIDTIGVCPTGLTFLTNYDPASNWGGWTPGTAIKLGANGTITLGGSGNAIAALVESIPTAASPFLGVRFNAGN